MGSTATVTHTQKLPGGTVRTDFRAELRLIASETGDDMGYATGAVEAVGYRAFEYPDDNGVFTWADIRPNTGDASVAITQPENTRYGITVRRREGGDWVDIAPEIVILVDDTGGTQDSSTHLNPLPASMPVPTTDATKVPLAGGTMTGDLGTPDVVFTTPPGTPYATSDTSTRELLAKAGELAAGITQLNASLKGRSAVANYIKDGTAIQGAVIGDSVADHFNATTTGGYSWVERVRTYLRGALGLSSAGVGHRKATTLDTLEPNMEIGASDPAWNPIGFGMDGTFLDYNDTVTWPSIPIEAGGKITVNWNQQSGDTNLSLLEVVSSIDGVLTGAGLDGYNVGAGGFAGTGSSTWTSSALTEGTHTFTIRCKTHASKQSGVTFLNVNTDQGLQLWNGGHFGATTSSWLTETLSGHLLNLDLLGSSGIDADFVIVMLGLNEDDPDEFRDGLEAIVAGVEAMVAAGRNPTWFFCTPWSKGAGTAPARTEAENAEFVQAVIDAADSVGAHVIHTHAVIGDGYTNALGLLDTDRIHPNDLGHAALTIAIFAEVARVLGLTGGGVPSVAGYTGPVTAAQLLTALKTVDGTGTGLDADLLDGHDTAYFATDAAAEHVANKDTDGTLAANSDTKYPSQKAVVTYVAARIAALVAGAPGLLDTLDELAAALNDDANFASTVTTALAGKQSLDADLTAIAALVSAANKLAYATGTGTWALTDFTAYARSLLDDADATTARQTLGLVLGTDVQAFDSDLAAIAALSTNVYGRALLTLADQAALMALLSAASTSTAGIVQLATDGELSTSKVPTSNDAGLNRGTFVNTSALRLFREAMGDVANNPVRINIVGDSVDQGSDASALAKRWTTVFEKEITGRFNTRPWRRGLVRPYTVAGAQLETWDTVEGTANNSIGFGGYGRTLLAASSQKLIITEKCVGFDLYYTKQKSGGSNLEVYVDGSLITTLNTLDGALTPSTKSGYKWSSSALTFGSHELKVIASGSGSAMVDGAYPLEETAGVRVFNSGHGGASTLNFNTAGTYVAAQDFIAQQSPHLVIIDTGRNDPVFGGRSAAQFGTDLGQLIDEIRAACTTCSILHIHSYQPGHAGWAGVTWSDYRAQSRSVARAKNIAFVDMYEVMGQMATSGVGSWGSTDGLHPGDKGMQAYTDAVMEVLFGASHEPSTAIFSDGTRDFVAQQTFRGSRTGALGEGGIEGNHLCDTTTAGLALRSLPYGADTAGTSAGQHYAGLSLTHTFGLASVWAFFDEFDSKRRIVQFIGRTSAAAGTAVHTFLDRLVVKRGSSGQTQNLTEWQDESAVVLAKVASDGQLTAPTMKASGLTGATSATRYVGATTSGAPASGTFAVGDYVIDQTGRQYVCTSAGSPGTWLPTGGPLGLTGATAATRYAGGTADGPPTSGTFAVGDYVVDQLGRGWVCISAGSPGTWRNVAKRFVRKTADESVTSSAALQNDDELLFSLGTTGTYRFDCELFTDGVGAGDIQVAFTVPTGAVLRATVVGLISSAGGVSAQPVILPLDTSGTSVTIGTTGGTTRIPLKISGTVRCDGSHSGNLQLQWAQGSSSGTATTVEADSWMEILRVA